MGTTFGTIQIFPFKEQRRILETDGGTFGPYKTGKMGDASVTASSWRLVERGRVVLFKKGQYAGKLAAIAQIIDHRRVLVEGFSSDASKVVPRHAAPLSYVTLTGIVIPKVPLAVGHTALQKLWNNEKVEEKWANSKTAQTSAKLMRRRQLNDFERFQGHGFEEAGTVRDKEDAGELSGQEGLRVCLYCARMAMCMMRSKCGMCDWQLPARRA